MAWLKAWRATSAEINGNYLYIMRANDTEKCTTKEAMSTARKNRNNCDILDATLAEASNGVPANEREDEIKHGSRKQ